MRRMMAYAAALIAVLAQPVAARENDADIARHLRAGTAVTIAPDTAYLLVRNSDILAFRFVRIDDEGRRGPDGLPIVDPANLVDLAAYLPFDKAPPRTHLLAVKPGTYWLYGEKTRFHLEGPFLNCLCLGTVKFEARAGTITDLGTIRNLARETKDGKRPDATGQARTLLGNRDVRAILVEPATAGQAVPAALAALPRVPAVYHAAGRLPNIDGTMIDRISAMPGVIGYDRDRIIDLRTGAALP